MQKLLRNSFIVIKARYNVKNNVTAIEPQTMDFSWNQIFGMATFTITRKDMMPIPQLLPTW